MDGVSNGGEAIESILNR